MEIVPLMMRVLNKNDKFLHIQEEINARTNMMLQKHKELSNFAHTNEYLEGIKNDYSKYYDTFVQQKQDQIKALELLDNYIEDMKDKEKDGENSTLRKLEDMKIEQKRILKEIAGIKKSLEDIL